MATTLDTSARLPSLTGLRFVAALLVFVHHSSHLMVFSDTAITEAYGQLARNAASIGVSFFFVLSGFVLTWSVQPGDTAPRFLRRRFFKIFPNHVVVYVVALLLLLASAVPIDPVVAG